jgi:hypothetical protein
MSEELATVSPEAPTGGCTNQRIATRYVDKEIKRLTSRMMQNRVAVLVNLCVYAHNCDSHGTKDLVHIDYVAGGGRQEVPGSLPSVIKAIEHLLATLRAKTQ